MPTPAMLSNLAVWATRAAWLLTAVIGGSAVGGATATRSEAVQTVATVGAWSGWAVGALALAVPSTAALTVLRCVLPASAIAAAATAIFGADPGDVLALTLPAAVAAVLAGSAELGRAYVQASAYGDEQRFGLRPPLGYLGAVVTTWLVWTVAIITAPLAIAARSWVLGVLALAVAVAGGRLLPVRWHQLSRRWFVLVPAGAVLHDPVLLGETLMVPRRQVAAIQLVELGVATRGGAADLTGPTPGLAIEIALTEPITVLLAPRHDSPRGTTIRLAAFLISPTRPGSVVAAAGQRAMPPPSTNRSPMS